MDTAENINTNINKRKMLGSFKSFDFSEHKNFDKKGKDAFINYLNKTKKDEQKHIENPNKYGIDILSLNSNNEVIFCWEIEVRHGNWKGDIDFPFKEINCLERKDHQWKRSPEFIKNIPYKMAKDYDVWYVQMNDICTKAVLINSIIILDYPLKQWSNRKIEGEFVRQVPIEKTKQLKL